MRYNHTPIGVAKIQTLTPPRADEDAEQQESLSSAGSATGGAAVEDA